MAKIVIPTTAKEIDPDVQEVLQRSYMYGKETYTVLEGWKNDFITIGLAREVVKLQRQVEELKLFNSTFTKN